jgi:hypothetical protein
MVVLSVLHGYGYTCRLGAGLGMGMSMGIMFWTCQKPIPVTHVLSTHHLPQSHAFICTNHTQMGRIRITCSIINQPHDYQQTSKQSNDCLCYGSTLTVDQLGPLVFLVAQLQ